MKFAAHFKTNYLAHLRQQMIIKGASVKQIANLTGYSYEGIRQALKGKGSAKSILSICKALEVDIKNILKGV